MLHPTWRPTRILLVSAPSGKTACTCGTTVLLSTPPSGPMRLLSCLMRDTTAKYCGKSRVMMRQMRFFSSSSGVSRTEGRRGMVRRPEFHRNSTATIKTALCSFVQLTQSILSRNNTPLCSAKPEQSRKDRQTDWAMNWRQQTEHIDDTSKISSQTTKGIGFSPFYLTYLRSPMKQNFKTVSKYEFSFNAVSCLVYFGICEVFWKKKTN